MKNKTLLVDLQVKDMYKSFLASHNDMFADDFEFFQAHSQDFIDGMEALGTKDVKGIRQMFRDGATFAMMDINKLDKVPADGNSEVRIWDDGKLLMVLVNDEVNY
jgi:hypothetical protein